MCKYANGLAAECEGVMEMNVPMCQYANVPMVWLLSAKVWSYCVRGPIRIKDTNGLASGCEAMIEMNLPIAGLRRAKENFCVSVNQSIQY